LFKKNYIKRRISVAIALRFKKLYIKKKLPGNGIYVLMNGVRKNNEKIREFRDRYDALTLSAGEFRIRNCLVVPVKIRLLEKKQIIYGKLGFHSTLFYTFKIILTILKGY
jgi:hypothetical protein